ncbi:hypothetical protein [Streptomyces sp. NPDC050416]|uniref:hypothetical protein n=1 Tax=Streptomyces sp. NPDC050416 TaxID=3365611 RepID=UPI0037943B75
MPPQAPPPGLLTRLRRRIGPIRTARRVFKPSRPDLVEDPFIARMQRIRTFVGLGAVVWVSVSYKIAHSVEDMASDRFSQSWISVLVLSVTLPVVVGVLTALTAPSARRDLLRRAAKSFGAILALIAGVFVFPATVDIHQTMPPLLAMTLVWDMALIDVFTGAYAGVPGPVRAVFALGAPLSVTAVGLWELRVHYGISVRGVLAP